MKCRDHPRLRGKDDLYKNALCAAGDFQCNKKDCPQAVFLLTGNFLSSQAVSSQVLSAFMCLTAVFGMGTGGAT